MFHTTFTFRDLVAQFEDCITNGRITLSNHAKQRLERDNISYKDMMFALYYGAPIALPQPDRVRYIAPAMTVLVALGHDYFPNEDRTRLFVVDASEHIN